MAKGGQTFFCQPVDEFNGRFLTRGNRGRHPGSLRGYTRAFLTDLLATELFMRAVAKGWIAGVLAGA
jgi:hypothetical protein